MSAGARLELIDNDPSSSQWSFPLPEGYWQPTAPQTIDSGGTVSINICQLENTAHPNITSNGSTILTCTAPCVGDAFWTCFYEASAAAEVEISMLLNGNKVAAGVFQATVASGCTFTLTRRLSLVASDTIEVVCVPAGAPASVTTISPTTSAFYFRTY